MILHVLERLKPTAILLVVCVLLVSFLAVPMEAQTCEGAFLRCWEDYSWMPLTGTVYCGAGYLFCKKYIEG